MWIPGPAVVMVAPPRCSFSTLLGPIQAVPCHSWMVTLSLDGLPHLLTLPLWGRCPEGAEGAAGFASGLRPGERPSLACRPALPVGENAQDVRGRSPEGVRRRSSERTADDIALRRSFGLWGSLQTEVLGAVPLWPAGHLTLPHGCGGDPPKGERGRSRSRVWEACVLVCGLSAISLPHRMWGRSPEGGEGAFAAPGVGDTRPSLPAGISPHGRERAEGLLALQADS